MFMACIGVLRILYVTEMHELRAPSLNKHFQQLHEMVVGVVQNSVNFRLIISKERTSLGIIYTRPKFCVVLMKCIDFTNLK